MMKRIGILGGSYNPPHKGHLEIAEVARAALGLDEVWLWVSYNIFKDPSVYALLEDRTAMTRLLAGAGRPWLKVMDIEKDFYDTMTATSLTMLQSMQPDDRFVWIFGDDNFASFHTWDRLKFKVNGVLAPDWQYILNDFSVAVMHRPGYRDDARASIAARYGQPLFVEDPQALARRGNGGWTFVNNEAMTESSTHIKQQLLAGERNIGGLTAGIESHIYGRGLYGTRAGFNSAAAAPMARNNDVRLHTFLFLAATANLLKSTGAHAGVFDACTILAHADSAWRMADASGAFARSGDVPESMAHNLRALNGLVHLCTYSLRGVEAGMQACAEALAVLCAREGLERHRMINLLRLVLDHPDATDMNAAFERSRGLLKAMCEDAGIEWQGLLKSTIKTGAGRAPDGYPRPGKNNRDFDI